MTQAVELLRDFLTSLASSVGLSVLICGDMKVIPFESAQDRL